MINSHLLYQLSYRGSQKLAIVSTRQQGVNRMCADAGIRRE